MIETNLTFKGESIVIIGVITSDCRCGYVKQYKISDLNGEWTSYVNPENIDGIG